LHQEPQRAREWMRQSSTTLFSMTSSALAVIAAPIRASNLTAGAASSH
jgi:hypothetical protein